MTEQPDARTAARKRRLEQRWLTLGGNRVAVAVGNTDTDVVVTLAPQEFDANYGVLATPSWDTTVWVSGKQVDEFTLNFGTAASGAQSVDVVVFREE